jgi:hypothetical protein
MDRPHNDGVESWFPHTMLSTVLPWILFAPSPVPP